MGRGRGIYYFIIKLGKTKIKGKGLSNHWFAQFQRRNKKFLAPWDPIFYLPPIHFSFEFPLPVSPPPPDSCQMYTSMHVLLIGRSVFLLFLQSNPHILGDHWSTEDLTPILKIKKRGKKKIAMFCHRNAVVKLLAHQIFMAFPQTKKLCSMFVSLSSQVYN